jgi:hypothetical protein
MRKKKLPALDRVLQRLAFLRMFLPLVALSVLAIGTVGLWGEQTLESRQHQWAQFMVRIIDRYLDQAARTLDAVARAAKAPPSENLDFIQEILEAYGYFDTLYYLDINSKIRLLVPPDPRYLGLDMSNLPSFKQGGLYSGSIWHAVGSSRFHSGQAANQPEQPGDISPWTRRRCHAGLRIRADDGSGQRRPSRTGWVGRRGSGTAAGPGPRVNLARVRHFIFFCRTHHIA